MGNIKCKEIGDKMEVLMKGLSFIKELINYLLLRVHPVTQTDHSLLLPGDISPV